MSDGKPFWSSAPGVVTGIASIVTAIVGLLGISVQAGWIGGDDGKASSNDGVTTTTPSTVLGASTVPGARTATTVAAKQGEFEVDPDSVTFEALKPKEATVVVRNIGEVALTMRKPTISVGSTAFKASDVSCTTTPLAPDARCEILVTFTATQPGDNYEGVLVIAAADAPRQVEVDLKGIRGLLG